MAQSLLDRGFQVRALTRDPQKPEAQALADQGVEVMQGDMQNRSAMEQVLEGAYGIFSVQNFWETGYDREVQQGKTVADATKEAGVQHCVYSSVGSAHRQTGILHFDRKWEVEEHVRKLDLRYDPASGLLHAELGDDARANPRGYPGSAARPGQAVPARGCRGRWGLSRHSL